MPRKTPIFSLLRQKADKGDYQLLETEESKKKFFLKAIPISLSPLPPPIELKEGGQCELLSHHVSIYEYYSDTIDILTVYHFTFEVRDTNTGERLKIRCYFTAQGIFTRITCKQGEEFRALSEISQQKLIYYAQYHMQPIRKGLVNEIEGACKKLWKQIKQRDTQLEEFNKEPKKHLECLHHLYPRVDRAITPTGSIRRTPQGQNLALRTILTFL